MPTFRPATVEDSFACYQVFRASIMDFGARTGVMAITGGDDITVLEKLWHRRRGLFEHLARTAEHYWLAEEAGQVLGYARSTNRGGVRELTEFFVLPGQQSAGVGKELLARAFPCEGAKHRLIIATADVRAQARYLKAGVTPYFPLYTFLREPQAVPLETDLQFTPLTAESLPTLNHIDAELFGHTREVDHAWLITDRQGYIYQRGGQAVGYGYVGDMSGPFALLHAEDFPAALAHAENEAAAHAWPFSVDVPVVNRAAVDYLLSRGCQIDSFIALVMAEAPLTWARFENYLFTSPPFFM
jgi:GNAT superfamily N-acetyltransferase